MKVNVKPEEESDGVMEETWERCSICCEQSGEEYKGLGGWG